MELRHLRYLLAVVDAGTISAASQRLRIAQPAISRQLRNLERELGLTLFDRAGPRMHLSAAGRAFLPVARDLVDRAERAGAAAAHLAAGNLERVVIATTTAAANGIITPFIATLAPPDPLILVRETAPARAHALLYTGADLAVTTVPAVAPTVSRPLAPVTVRAHVAADDPWAGREEVGLAELLSRRLVLLTHEHITRVVLDQAVAAAGLSYPDLVECALPNAVLALAAAGYGTGVVSDDPAFGTAPVLIVDPRTGAPLTLMLFAAWQRQHYAAPALARLAERIARFVTGDDGAHPVATGATP